MDCESVQGNSGGSQASVRGAGTTLRTSRTGWGLSSMLLSQQMTARTCDVGLSRASGVVLAAGRGAEKGLGTRCCALERGVSNVVPRTVLLLGRRVGTSR